MRIAKSVKNGLAYNTKKSVLTHSRLVQETSGFDWLRLIFSTFSEAKKELFFDVIVNGSSDKYTKDLQIDIHRFFIHCCAV